MSFLLSSVGFSYSSDEEFARIYSLIKDDGEIVTTTRGIYYRWASDLDEGVSEEA